MISSTSGFARVLAAFAASIGWMITSSWLIVLNRHILVDLGFPFPMFLSGMGMVASWVLAWLCCSVLRLIESKAPAITIKFWCTRLLPVGFFMAVTLWSGNEVYMHLSVAFIQMLKAFTPVITLLCLLAAGLETFTLNMAASVLLITFGTVMAAVGEMRLSTLGLLLNTVSAVSESVRLVMTQWLLTGLKFHPIEGLMYLAPACTLWLYAGALVWEGPKMMKHEAWTVLSQPGAPLKFALAAVLGFLVNVLAFVSIKLASSLTLKVLGTAKNTLLVVGSVIFLGEVVTAVQGLGYAVALAGFGWYNHIKASQIAHGAPSPSPHSRSSSGGGSKDGLEPASISPSASHTHMGPPAKPIMDSAASLTQPLLTYKSSGAV